MPLELPEEIRRSVQDRMMPTHRMLWTRCEFLSMEDVERPPRLSDLLMLSTQRHIPRDTRLTVADIDNSGEGYDLRLQWVGHDIAPEDTLFLLGHEPLGATRLTQPRLLYNVNTGRYYRTYPDLGNGSYLTMLEYKYSLSCKAPATLDNRVRDISHKFNTWFTSPHTPLKKRIQNGVCAGVLLWITQYYLGTILAVRFDPYHNIGAIGHLMFLSIIALVTGLMVGIMLLFYIGQRVRQAILEPPSFRNQREYSFAQLIGFDNVTNYLLYTYTDITYLYEDVAKRLGEWVEAHPDPETPFMLGLKRQTKEKGTILGSPLNPQYPFPALAGAESAGNTLTLSD